MEQNIEILDSASALASVGGDLEFLSELAGLIQAAWPTLLDKIRQNLAAGRLDEVKTHARLAQAAAGYVSARRARASALQLQLTAGKGDLQGAQSATALLEEEVARLCLVLPTLGAYNARPHEV